MICKRILFALDLEGVNNVVGEPYSGLGKDSPQWHVAKKQAALEVNAAADALFASGVEKIGLWDNHGGGGNIDVSAIDSRMSLISSDENLPRMYFADDEYDAICFFGYHAMEGTLGGVLAHTMNSKSVQYYKLNGRYIGEVDMDAYIAAEKGIPAVFFAGGNIACRQAKRAVSGIVTVETKKELSRNEAIFRNNEDLFADIRENIVKAVTFPNFPRTLKYPSVIEKSFKRVEDAEKYLAKLRRCGINASYPDDDILGKDAHTVTSIVYGIDDFINCI